MPHGTSTRRAIGCVQVPGDKIHLTKKTSEHSETSEPSNNSDGNENSEKNDPCFNNIVGKVITLTYHEITW